jgi:hypothetical protein
VADLDEPRYLGQKLGYTHVAHRSIDPSAECVSEAEQRRQTTQAHLRERRDRVDAWRACHSVISDALATFKASCRVPKSAASSLRVVERACARVDRDVASG